MKIGIDIGGSHIASGIILEKGRLLGKESRDINVTNIINQKRVENIILETIQAEIRTFLQRYDYTVADISKIGLAVPGSPTDTTLRRMVNLHIKNFNIAEKLNEMYKAKVRIKNDGKCAGIAEKEFGALKNYDDCVFLCIGTGVGSAVFLNKELLEPKQNSGFELGHMIIDINGVECNCGKKGCFETYASMKKFKNSGIRNLKLPDDMTSEEWQNYIRKNLDKSAVNKYVNNYLDKMAVGVSNIINIFEPQAICFGGSFSYYADIFLKILDKKIEPLKFNKDTKVKLLPAKLKNDAGIIGSTII